MKWHATTTNLQRTCTHHTLQRRQLPQTLPLPLHLLMPSSRTHTPMLPQAIRHPVGTTNIILVRFIRHMQEAASDRWQLPVHTTPLSSFPHHHLHHQMKVRRSLKPRRDSVRARLSLHSRSLCPHRHLLMATGATRAGLVPPLLSFLKITTRHVARPIGGHVSRPWIEDLVTITRTSDRRQSTLIRGRVALRGYMTSVGAHGRGHVRIDPATGGRLNTFLGSHVMMLLLVTIGTPIGVQLLTSGGLKRL